MNILVRGSTAVDGTTSVPGDKSISHRALLLASIADGRSEIGNIGPGDDVASTIRCLECYGTAIERTAGGALVHGKGIRSWSEPPTPLDCGNSGTTMRLLTGLAAHHSFASVLDGDASLRARPMDRLVGPLEAFGAHVETSDGRPPITVNGGRLRGAAVAIEVPSAQVKTAALFAGLAAEGRTVVTEPALSRDHTERLLAALGASITSEHDGAHRVELEPFDVPAFEIEVPGDPSSAAFLIAAAVLCGHVRIDGVALNPTRLGFIDILARMGAEVRTQATSEQMGEPIGSIEAERSELSSVGIEGPLVPILLDELPLLAVVATQARGTTVVRGAAELRVKESDRISTTVGALRRLGATAEELPDGFEIEGPTALTGTKVGAEGDHRIAMALAVAGLIADGETLVEGFDAADVSWPGFDRVLNALGAKVERR